MFVSVLTIRGILDEVARQGVAADQVLLGSDLTPEDLRDMRTLVDIDQYEHIVTRAMELARDPGLGLSVGINAPESMFQLMSYLAASVPTLRHAFELFQHYSGLFVDDLRLSLVERGEEAEFSFGFHAGAEDNTARFASECMSTFCIRLVGQHFAKGMRAHRLHFKHARPSYHHRYETFFGCPIMFGQDSYSMFFDADLLDRPQPHADSAMTHVLRSAADEMLRTFGQRVSTAERLRALLRREPDLCSVDLKKLAANIGMTPRSMRRRLATEGVTFSTLLQEARIQIARTELLRPGMVIKEVGERLGYSETTAFHRAFKRCTGQTPLEYVRDVESRNAAQRKAAC